MSESERRLPWPITRWLVGGILLVVLIALAMGLMIPADCPECQGGRVAQISLGAPLSCHGCEDRKHVSLLRASYLRMMQWVSWHTGH